MTKRFQTNFPSSSGTLDSVAAGTIVGGPTLDMDQVVVGTLSARFVVDAESNSLTMAPAWQISTNSSTWFTVADANNAAATVLASGTGGADASVTTTITAPPAVYGARYARACVLTGGATGASADTYAIGYNYRLESYY